MSSNFRYQVLTVFPEMIEGFLRFGLIGQAHKNNIFSVSYLNPRNHTTDNYHSVDDRPFGGGDGMIYRPEILEKTLLSGEKTQRVIYLSPQGPRLNHQKVTELRQKNHLTLICGRYGGIDQRFINSYVDEEISIGDYVLNGGELAACVLLDAVIRGLPGVLGDERSAENDSFVNSLLEAPQFTRPSQWNQQDVPSILTSGHHQNIDQWKKQMSLLVTLKKRPDLLNNINQSEMAQLKSFYLSLSEKEKEVCGVAGLHFN